jgi:hypothetical protein
MFSYATVTCANSRPVYWLGWPSSGVMYILDNCPKNLKVKILTPPKAPYIVDSSIDLTQEKEMVYTANLVGLPHDDLSFTLYSKEKVTALDKVQGYLQNRLGYFTPVVMGMLVLLILGVMTKTVLKIKNGT